MWFCPTELRGAAVSIANNRAGTQAQKQQECYYHSLVRHICKRQYSRKLTYKRFKEEKVCSCDRRNQNLLVHPISYHHCKLYIYITCRASFLFLCLVLMYCSVQRGFCRDMFDFQRGPVKTHITHIGDMHLLQANYWKRKKTWRRTQLCFKMSGIIGAQPTAVNGTCRKNKTSLSV